MGTKNRGFRVFRPKKSKHDSLSHAWFHIKQLSEVAEKVLDGTPFKAVLSLVNHIIDFCETIAKDKKELEYWFSTLAEHLRILVEHLRESGEKTTLPQDAHASCKRLIGVLQDALRSLERMGSRTFLQRILHAGEPSQKIMDITRRIGEASMIFSEQLAIGNAKYLNRILINSEAARLRELNPQAEATYAEVGYDSCVEGTREDILKVIHSWSDSPTSPAIFWLSGMAGTGKSTIASTLSKRLYGHPRAKSRRLGASFFCSSQVESRRMRKNIVPTIAYGLAQNFSPFGQGLLRSDLDIEMLPLEHQIEHLLILPWCDSIAGYEGLPPFVVVIDALDELNDDEGLEFLHDLIRVVNMAGAHLRGLKFFVTSRRDPRIIKLCSSSNQTSSTICLEHAPKLVVQRDIEVYLEKSLPGLDKSLLDSVAAQASNLFIYAATAVRFIGPKNHIDAQNRHLQIILDHWPHKSEYEKKEMVLDVMYERVLGLWLSHVPVVDRQHAISVLQTVVYSAEPILLPDIPFFLEPDDPVVKAGEATKIIESLHAVLHVREGRVYCYHESFIDFVKDSARFLNQELAMRICNPERETALAIRCVSLVKSALSGRSRDSQILEEHVMNPSVLGYAFRHWDTHYVMAPHSSRGTLKLKIVAIAQSKWPSISLFRKSRKVMPWNNWAKKKKCLLLSHGASLLEDLEKSIQENGEDEEGSVGS